MKTFPIHFDMFPVPLFMLSWKTRTFLSDPKILNSIYMYFLCTVVTCIVSVFVCVCGSDSLTGELKISNHSESFVGIYTCEVSNIVGKERCKFSLRALKRKFCTHTHTHTHTLTHAHTHRTQSRPKESCEKHGWQISPQNNCRFLSDKKIKTRSVITFQLVSTTMTSHISARTLNSTLFAGRHLGVCF